MEKPNVLPTSFSFSQASLQDYVDCPRRFQLRYVLNVRWPGLHTQSVVDWERRAQQGALFHRLVHQHTIGIPTEVLEAAVSDEQVKQWWHAYVTSPPTDLPTTVRRSEVRLSMPFEMHRLVARYDLLAVEPGQRAVIVDWKTSQKPPRRSWLEKRLQTQVYRHVLVKAGARLNSNIPVLPDQVELIYWFVNDPARMVRFPYDAKQHALAGERLATLVNEIVAQDVEQWTLTSDLTKCGFCPYQTLCDRQGVASPEEEPDSKAEQTLFELDLEQIAEIEF